MAEEFKPSRQRKYPYRSIYFPLLLVAIGVILLLNSLHIIQGDTWQVLIRLWPVLLIIGGLDSLFQRRNYVSSVFGIGVGVLFLMYYFNFLLPWNIQLWDILRLWPFLLLAWGLDIIVGHKNILSLLMGVLVGVLLIAGLFWLLLNPLAAPPASNIIPLEQPLEDVQSGEINISMTSARLTIGGEVEPSQFMIGKASLRDRESVVSSYTLQGSKGIYRIEGQNPGSVVNANSASSLDIKLTSAIPLVLYTDVNVGDQDIDLSEIQIERFTLNQSVGQVVLTLPENTVFHGSIMVPLGDVIIYVKKGAVLRIAMNNGLTVISYPPDYIRRGDIITSPGVGDKNEVATLHVSVPVGMVRIVERP